MFIFFQLSILSLNGQGGVILFSRLKKKLRTTEFWNRWSENGKHICCMCQHCHIYLYSDLICVFRGSKRLVYIFFWCVPIKCIETSIDLNTLWLWYKESYVNPYFLRGNRRGLNLFEVILLLESNKLPKGRGCQTLTSPFSSIIPSNFFNFIHLILL